MALTPFVGDPPTRDDPDNFSARGDAMMTWMVNLVTELNELLLTGGVLAIPYTLVAGTTDVDPAAGGMAFNNATQNASTVLRLDLLDQNGGDWTTVIDSFDDSTSAIKGQLRLVSLNDGTKFLTFNVTAVASPSGYRNVSVTNTGGSAASPFTTGDPILVAFTRTGDMGMAGFLFTYSTTTTATDPTAGKVQLNHATIASATALYISETDGNGGSIGPEIATWDDSTSTNKAKLIFRKVGAPANFAIFHITGTNTDNGAWDTVNLSYVAGGGTLTNQDAIQIEVYLIGNTGAAGANGSDGADGSGLPTNMVVGRTTNYPFTSTPTLMTSAQTSFGFVAKLPAAGALTPVEGMHVWENTSPYPGLLMDDGDNLKGFVFSRKKSTIGLAVASALGTWSVSDLEPVGISAQLISLNTTTVDACIDLGTGYEMLIMRGNGSNIYCVVHDLADPALFSAVTVVRTGSFGASLVCACLNGANQVLVCSVASGAATFEAVTITSNGTASPPTVNSGSKATATLSANITAFAGNMLDGRGAGNGFGGVIAVTGGFVVSYLLSGPTTEARGLIVSGVAVSVSAAEVLGGTAGGLLQASGDKAIAVSTSGSNLYGKPYTLSAGPTLTPGTGFTYNSTSKTLVKYAPLGTRWFVGFVDGTDLKGGVISLSGTTTTLSWATLFTTGGWRDAFIVGSNRVCVTNSATTANCNILTDTAGTASAGTAIDAGQDGNKAIIGGVGTNVLIGGAGTNYGAYVDCSGSSPVLLHTMAANASETRRWYTVSDSTLQPYPYGLRNSSGFAQSVLDGGGGATGDSCIRWESGVGRYVPVDALPTFGTATPTPYRGRLPSEIWLADTSGITKMECIQ